ncbi:hypothetical protein [Actinokineospora xionganensis]|uniref:ASCH domain-containing protein n=1 Tax=Actinokineospora xionganensis TaxID=2684470 RepID=A0ABR7LG14_9PSEU|nr:hypothetical protein [Actinokineospora xionganensis]MBC6451309.1 hypothetical protein [Actinokineospora xionganensis]
MPPAVWERIQEGNKFNVERRPHYPVNEIRLSTGKVVDSYRDGAEIVERKHTQLAEIKEETAFGYLAAMSRKYSPGEEIADSPRNRDEFPELVGEPLDGVMILEVPPQRIDVPRAILERAAELDVTIRDSEGKEYTL